MMNKYFTPEIDITQTNNGLDVLAISPGNGDNELPGADL